MNEHLYLQFSGILIPTITNIHYLYLGRAQLIQNFALTLPDKHRLVAVGNYSQKITVRKVIISTTFTYV